MDFRKLKRLYKDQRGAVAATYALALIPLIAIAGLGFDYARLAGMDTELQNAADQAALAGATQLDRTAGSMERAILAAQGGLVANSTLFSNDGVGRTVAVTDAGTQVIFYSNRTDAEAGTNGFTDTSRFAEAGFVQVIVDTRASNFSLTPVVGAIAGDLTGAAVAGMGSAVCRIPPLMICNPEEPSSGDQNAGFTASNYLGIGLLVVQGGNNAWAPGNFGYLDLGDGANGVREGLGWISPDDKCLAVDGVDTIGVDTEPGVIADAPDSLNTRFDIYDNTACRAGGECPAALNSRKDVVRDPAVPPATGNSCGYSNASGATGWRQVELADRYMPTDPAVPLATTVTPKSMGHPRDMCHAVSDGGVCANNPFGDGWWDINAYFRSHYGWDETTWRTNAKTGSSPVTLPADNTTPITVANIPSRYKVYKWEEANRNAAIGDKAQLLQDRTITTGGNTRTIKADQVCSQQYGYAPIATPDRRVMSVAVVNCVGYGVRGSRRDVPVETWIDVFLVQPSLNRGTGANKRTTREEIYIEIVGETQITGTGNLGGSVIRRDVPYLLK